MAPRRPRAGTPPHGRGRGDRTGADELVRRGAHRGFARPRGPERARGRQRDGVSRGHRKIKAVAGANGTPPPARRLRKDEGTRTDRPPRSARRRTTCLQWTTIDAAPVTTEV